MLKVRCARYQWLIVDVNHAILCLFLYSVVIGMLTPFFTISQNSREITLVVKAPLANIAKTELEVIEDLVIFSATPYYLRLHLPGKLLAYENECGQFDSGHGEFTFKLLKETEGEHFEDLDLVGKLLEPSRKFQTRNKPKVEICGEVVPSSDPESDNEGDSENEYLIKQELPSLTNPTGHYARYGFANKVEGNRQELRYEFLEILDLRDVDSTPLSERALLREAEEESRFSEDHYLADFVEPEGLDEIMAFVPPWYDDQDEVTLTQDEGIYLKDLGNRDYIIDSSERKMALYSLCDILFGYAYAFRTYLGEDSVETAWTVNKLSSTLSWLQSFPAVKEVKRACIRRSLIYPLFRNWELSLLICRDTAKILHRGRREILKCLIDIHKKFNLSEPRYLLNQLYLTDYCIWVQKIPEKYISDLAVMFEEVQVAKEDVGLQLEELEAAALLVIEEEKEIENVGNLINQFNLDESDETESESNSRTNSCSSGSEDEPDC